jgi:hypothetical protein
MKKWLLNQLPMKVVTLTLLFSGSTHGWERSKFHELCDEKGPTITVMKSKAGKVFGGFAMQSWDSETGYKADEMAFIYSIDRQQIYRATDAQKALYCYSSWGPSFGACALGLYGDPLNGENVGYCYTHGKSNSIFYRIKSDDQGNQEVTG